MIDPLPASAPKVLSGRKRLLGLGALVVVMVVSGAIGLALRREPVPEAAAPSPFSSVALALVGVGFWVVAGVAYGLIYVTRAFTFRFDRPFFRAYRFKALPMKVVVELPLAVGFSFVCAPLLLTMLDGVVRGQLLALVAFGVPFVMAQFTFAWLATLAPVERLLIERRMAAMGLGPDRAPGGLPMGVSDPARNSMKKFPLVEEDLGMLWISPTHVSYRGDTTAWDFARADVLDVERKADAGSTSSYFGAVHVILRVRQADGSERRIRLHPEGRLTQTGTARALDALAADLNLWRSTGTAD